MDEIIKDFYDRLQRARKELESDLAISRKKESPFSGLASRKMIEHNHLLVRRHHLFKTKEDANKAGDFSSPGGYDKAKELARQEKEQKEKFGRLERCLTLQDKCTP